MEPATCAIGASVDGASVRSLVVLFAVFPIVVVVLQDPQTGVVSDSLAASGIEAQIFCSLGFVLSAIVELLALGRPHGLVSSTFFAATIFSTWNQPTLATSTECAAYCYAHLVSVALLMAVVLVGLFQRGVRLVVIAAVAAVMLAIAVCYNVVVNDDNFDATDPAYRRWLALCGALEVGLVLFERSVAASVPVRGAEPEYARLCA